MKHISHNCPKLFFKATTESRVPKKLPKIPTLLPEAASKLVRKIVQSCSPRHWSPKLRFCKSVRQNGSPKPFCKAAPEATPQSCCRKLHSKIAMLQTCSPKRLLEAAPASQGCSPKLLHKAGSPKPFPKIIIESCSEQLLPKAVKILPKLLLKATPQSCRSSKELFVNAAAKPQNCSPQLLPKVALQSCY